MAPGRSIAERLLPTLRRAAVRRSAHIAALVPERVRRGLDLPSVPTGSIVPSEDQLRRWAVAVGLDYQAWCFHHGYLSEADWYRQREESLTDDWDRARTYSVLTPVHDTPAQFLRECVYSVQAQTYPYWELCIVDDASSDPATLAELERLEGTDPRIRIERLERNVGICEATNHALDMAVGSYVAFLDHDDRLAPDALFEVEAVLDDDPRLDLVYSDRDLLDPDNYRTHPTFKPGFAPETLLDGNYMFHLMVYRRSLVAGLGGYRAAYEGSQDLDLALRVFETRPLVAHVPKVLYHWRQHEGSMALLPQAKPHIFEAGIAAVTDALTRRGLEGVVEEIPDIWRGHYRVRLRHPDASRVVVRIDDPDDYRRQVADVLATTDAEHLVVLGPGVDPEADDTIAELCAWLSVPDVVATTGRVVSSAGLLRHAGLVRHVDGVPRSSWRGHPTSEPGYGAATVAIRNVSLVHPLVCAWRTDVLRSVGGLDGPHESPFAMLDAAVRADIERLRFVYDPLATFTCDDDRFEPEAWAAGDAARFALDRADVLTLDGHQNLNFDRDATDNRLALGAPLYPEDF